MTFTLSEVLLLVVAVTAMAFVIVFVGLSFQLRRTAAEMEETARHVRSLVSPAQRLLKEAESDVAEIRELARRTTQIAQDVQSVTGEASALTIQLLRALEGEVSDRARAAMVGARAGFAALRRTRSEDGSGTNGSNN